MGEPNAQDLLTAMTDVLDRYRVEQGLTHTRLAALSGLGLETLYPCRAKDHHHSTRTLAPVLETLGVPLQRYAHDVDQRVREIRARRGWQHKVAFLDEELEEAA